MNVYLEYNNKREAHIQELRIFMHSDMRGDKHMSRKHNYHRGSYEEYDHSDQELYVDDQCCSNCRYYDYGVCNRPMTEENDRRGGKFERMLNQYGYHIEEYDPVEYDYDSSDYDEDECQDYNYEDEEAYDDNGDKAYRRKASDWCEYWKDGRHCYGGGRRR